MVDSKTTDFPRGGSSVLTALEVKEISNEATSDVLFEQANAKRSAPAEKSSAKRQKKKSEPKADKEVDEEESVLNYVFNSMFAGTQIFGQITGVTELEVVISIGNLIFGVVPITSVSDEISKKIEEAEASDESDDEEEEGITKTSQGKELPRLKSLFKIGQFLRAKVIEKDAENSKRVMLTIEPEEVNSQLEDDDLQVGAILQCSVKSIEDHGVILTTGLSLPGFIPNKVLKKLGVRGELKVGQVLLLTITAKNSRTITLKPVHTELNTKKSDVATITSIDAIKPGSMVDSVVSGVTKSGITTRVFGLVDGSISLPHLGNYDHEKITKQYKVGSTITARVIGILLKDGSKKFLLSKLPHIVNMTQTPSEALTTYPSGTIIESAEVIAHDKKYIYFKVGEFFGQVHKSKIDPDFTLDVHYEVGSIHKARVLGFNNIDNLLHLTVQPKELALQYLSSADVPTGSLVNGCEVVQIVPTGGIMLKVFDDFDAFVPELHISDVKLAYPEKKFKVGTKCKARVLFKQGKRLQMTLKKSLINIDEEDILNTFEKATVGLRTLGTILAFVRGGALVTFFGNVKGFLPISEVSETFVENLASVYKLGQTIPLTILEVKQHEKKLIVTARQSTELSEIQVSALGEIIEGKTVAAATVVEKTSNSVIVELNGSKLRGVLRDGHLGDGTYEQNRTRFKKTSAGDEITVLVLEKDTKARAVIVTAKRSLVDAAAIGTLPLEYSNLKVNGIFGGFIRSITNMGLFVSFGNKLTGLVLPKHAADFEGEDLHKKFTKDQSVTCRVIRTDDENRRFLLALEDTDSGDFFGTDLIAPVDTSKDTFGDYTPGVITKGTVTSVEGFVNVSLAENLVGRIDPSLSTVELSKYEIGSTVDVKVIGYRDSKSFAFTPTVNAKFNKATVIELSLLDASTINISDIQEGSTITTYVQRSSKGFLWTSISPLIRGRIAYTELSEDGISEGLNVRFPPGTSIQGTVKNVDANSGVVSLKVRKSVVKSISDLKVGSTYPSKIFTIRDNLVLVEIGEGVVAAAYITDALNDYDQSLQEAFKLYDFACATVLSVEQDTGRASVSLRTTAKDRLINSIADIKRGDNLRGFVKKISNIGIHVSLGRSTYALVRSHDLFDTPVPDWKKHFKLQQTVFGKIVECDSTNRVLMTLKESDVNGNFAALKTFDELVVGDIFEGTVKSVMAFGVFVKLDGTAGLSGLCHHSEIADNAVTDVASLFSEGDRVKVIVLKVDADTRKMNLGMKASYFTEEDSDVEMEDAEAVAADEDDEDGDEEDDEDIESSEDEDDEIVTPKTTSKMSLSSNFDWTASILDQAEDDSSSDEEEDFTQKKTKKSKRKVEDKTGDLNTRAPQSVSDFERILVGNPNSSIMWMNYMSFQLQLSEIDKAREIGERALKTINYREELEKMNIWIALLNLENTFGGDETLDEVFKRSCQFMDSQIMHLKLVGIYTMSEKFDAADELYQQMTKKFSKSVAVWVAYGTMLLERKLSQETHEVLAKALQVLPKRDHIEVVRKFAQLEFTKGDAEQGRSLFEGLVADAPKRIDLWNVYLDQEIKNGKDNKKIVEGLFERVVGKKLSRKQAKFFFSKWLAFEEEKGDEQMAARVKAKATEFVKADK